MPFVRKITPFIALATLVLGLPVSASATDWRQFRYDIAQTGTNESETTLSPTTVGGLELAWTRSVGTEIGWTTPLVLGNETIMSAAPSTVAAYSTSTGRRIWSFDVPVGMPENTIAAGPSRVFVSTMNGPFYALDAATGELLWQRDLGSAAAGGATVSKGVLYASGGAHLYALDAATGAILWNTDAGGNIANISTPSVSNGVVVIGMSLKVRAFSQASGRRLWTHTFAKRYQSEAAIAGNAVFAVSGRWELKLDLATGDVIWQKTLVRGNRAASMPAIGDGLVVVHVDAADSGREIYTARSAATGHVVWSVGYPAAGCCVVPNSSAAIANGVVYVGASTPAVRAFDVATGEELWEGALNAGQHSSPSIVNGQLEIGTFAGTLYAFRLP
jgi:eukaryotic-like serine/threonine-protein kinase